MHKKIFASVCLNIEKQGQMTQSLLPENHSGKKLYYLELNLDIIKIKKLLVTKAIRNAIFGSKLKVNKYYQTSFINIWLIGF